MILKWLDYRYRLKHLKRWEEEPTNCGAAFEEGVCLFYTALWSWLRGAKDSGYEYIGLIRVIVCVAVLVGLCTSNIKSSRDDPPPERRFNIYILLLIVSWGMY